MSDLGHLEAGTAIYNTNSLDLRVLLAEVIRDFPALADRAVDVHLSTGQGPAMIRGDAARLKTAITSLLAALRRELVASTELFVKEWDARFDGRSVSLIAIGSADQIPDLETATEESVRPFDEWRGGCGLGLPVARRIIAGHGGSLWSAGGGPRTGAIVVLPR
jgi:signal transduction histidine kinase